MASYDYIGAKLPDGTILGRSASDLVAFHGGTPCDQAAYVAQVATTGLTTSLGEAQAAINSILTALIEKGLMAAS